ncbi:hypothetical protein CesoFtcFv8_012214 [Champsocephalus esox]|uniref:Uncharacterized protein n=1 Tax=Champsocephalus esox TaxID=159716 RepID=A0AAN8GUF0_9TELE|nr:hypothetical protein CesoFtcFv8_012214 [Champsocephalus esox]
MGSSLLSVTERRLRTLPFIPLLLPSLLWKWKIGPQAWVCAEELGGRAGTSDLSGLNKASLYPPPRSPHPNYTPDTSTILHLLPLLTAPPLPPHNTMHFPALIMALPLLKAPEACAISGCRWLCLTLCFPDCIKNECLMVLTKDCFRSITV